MKNVSTGKTTPIEDPDCPRTTVDDWDGAVLKQAGVVLGYALQTRMNEALRDWLKSHSPEALKPSVT